MGENWEDVLGKLPEGRKLEIKQEMEKRVRQDNDYLNSLVEESAQAQLSTLYGQMLDNALQAQGGMPLNPHQKALLYSQARQSLGMPND